jgi:glycosyltransferase involved in cell wall biosynthesis
MSSKVIVLGPGRKTRGGISTVIKEYEQTDAWEEFNCKWIETYIDKGSFHKIAYFIKGFFSYLRSILFHNIVHMHISWSTTAKRKFAFFLLAKALKKKIILHLHSGAEPVLSAKAQFPYKYMFKHADVTVFLAERIKNELNRHYQVQKSIVIYNPCLSNKKKSITQFADRKKQIVFAGTITEKKGYIDLIEAFAEIAPKYQEWKLIFAGNGEIENAQRICKRLNIENQVELKGWINRDTLQELLAESSVFCLPSYTEGFPMAVLDAWSQGLPVVATPVGGLADVLIHDKNAMVFNPGDKNHLAVLLDELMADENKRQRISVESVKLSLNAFNIDTIAKQLRELYVTLT